MLVDFVEEHTYEQPEVERLLYTKGFVTEDGISNEFL